MKICIINEYHCKYRAFTLFKWTNLHLILRTFFYIYRKAPTMKTELYRRSPKVTRVLLEARRELIIKFNDDNVGVDSHESVGYYGRTSARCAFSPAELPDIPTLFQNGNWSRFITPRFPIFITDVLTALRYFSVPGIPRWTWYSRRRLWTQGKLLTV